MLLVAEIREQMRRRGVSREQIHEFSSEALSGDPEDIRRICSQWVDTSARLSGGSSEGQILEHDD